MGKKKGRKVLVAETEVGIKFSISVPLHIIDWWLPLIINEKVINNGSWKNTQNMSGLLVSPQTVIEQFKPGSLWQSADPMNLLFSCCFVLNQTSQIYFSGVFFIGLYLLIEIS